MDLNSSIENRIRSPSLCETCASLDCSELFEPQYIFKHKSFSAISSSAETCPFCAIIVSAKDTVRYDNVPLGHLVTPLEEYPVLLSGRMETYLDYDESGNRETQQCFTGIDVGIPAKHNSTLEGMLQLTGPYVTGQLNAFIESIVHSITINKF